MTSWKRSTCSKPQKNKTKQIKTKHKTVALCSVDCDSEKYEKSNAQHETASAHHGIVSNGIPHCYYNEPARVKLSEVTLQEKGKLKNDVHGIMPFT